jgi:hypothetical protein
VRCGRVTAFHGHVEVVCFDHWLRRSEAEVRVIMPTSSQDGATAALAESEPGLPGSVARGLPGPSAWVGVGRFELPASSSRTKDSGQASTAAATVTSEVMSQDITSHPTGMQAPDARVTHAPEVYAKLEETMGVLAIALGPWEDRDDSKPQPEVRRAANTAMDAIAGLRWKAQARTSRRTSRRWKGSAARSGTFCRCCWPAGST